LRPGSGLSGFGRLKRAEIGDTRLRTKSGGDRSAVIELLNRMAVPLDFAKGVDHDAAAELWDRYSQGERNIFSRRLYTAQGQRIFDEIRRRYRSDQDFRQTVERYLTEFERLLEDIAQDDPQEVVVRTYLISDTGKVYTMLAHAAGRFD
jgi:hypothetical protein